MRYKRLAHLTRTLILNRASKLNLMVTARCTYRCKICQIWKIKNRFELSVEDIEKLLDRFKDTIWVSLTGGEPFLRDDLPEVVELGLSRCKGLHTVSIPTSGFSPKTIKENVEEILKLDIPSLYVSVSLDGPKEIHNKIKGAGHAFKNAVKTFSLLDRINEPRLKYHFEYAISKFNQGLLERTITSSGYRPNDFIITFAVNAPFYKNMGLSVAADSKALKEEVKWFLSEFKSNSAHDLVTRMFLRCVIRGKKIPCFAGRNSFFINYKGRVMPCIFKKGRRPGERCNCFSPCESYFSLLMGLRNFNLSVFF